MERRYSSGCNDGSLIQNVVTIAFSLWNCLACILVGCYTLCSSVEGKPTSGRSTLVYGKSKSCMIVLLCSPWSNLAGQVNIPYLMGKVYNLCRGSIYSNRCAHSQGQLVRPHEAVDGFIFTNGFQRTKERNVLGWCHGHRLHTLDYAIGFGLDVIISDFGLYGDHLW